VEWLPVSTPRNPVLADTTTTAGGKEPLSAGTLMRVKRAVGLTAVTMIALTGVATAAQSAHASGSSGRTLGCAAHWRTTAAWNECIDSPGAELRLQVDCNWQLDYTGQWRKVKGSANPIDRFECEQRANSAWNGYQ